MSDMSCYKTVALQKQTVFCRASLFPLAHAEGLEQPATRAPSVFIQEDLTQQESTAWEHGASVCRCTTLENDRGGFVTP